MLAMVFVFGTGINMGANASGGGDDTPEPELPTVVSESLTNDVFMPFPEEAEQDSAEAVDAGTLEINAKSVVLMEASGGTVLYENNSHEKLPPASVTKVMSMLLVMEAMEQGKFGLDDMVTASDHACSMGGSQIWLKPGETMSVHDLLKATAVGSANDATTALGELVAGTEEGFVNLMNARAAELGMDNTHFVNCAGLDAEGHLTTAHDVAIMSTELLKHETIKEFSTIWMDSLRDGATQLVNTNKLVRFYEGATGLKTGTTSGAGHCVSATAKRGDMELCAVVMGSDNSNDRFNGARKLLDYGFANWTTAAPEIDMSEDQSLKVVGGTAEQVTLQPIECKPLLVQKGREGEIQQIIELPEFVDAPVTADQTLGKATVMLDDKILGEYPILAAEEVPQLNLLRAFGKLWHELVRL